MKNQNNNACKFDVIIIGGGLAGLTQAALLGTQDIRVCCIDRENPADVLKAGFDGRTTAISYGSQKVLAAAGVWTAIEKEGCPIRRIEIMDGQSDSLLDFDSAEVGGAAFGWIFDNIQLRKALLTRCNELETVTHLAPAIVADFDANADGARVYLDDGLEYSAQLLVGADGRGSLTREKSGIGARGWSYRQRAIVCTVTHANPHENIAIENFRAEGPFAILPMNDDEKGQHRSSVVWTEHGPEADSAIHYDQDVFDAALTARFPDRYGAVAQSGGRFSYPLGLVHAHDYTGPRTALIAEAAHGIHPIAGQGLNMGLRDVTKLTELVIAAKKSGDDIGSERLLRTYQQARRPDNMAMAGATDILNRLFSNDIAPVSLLRRAGLKMVSRLPPAKRFFMHQAMGSGRHVQDIVKYKARVNSDH